MTKTIGIIGNPNVGKTYLFNRLTSCEGCVGNWAGVTSTACKAKISEKNASTILDLPGCHRLREFRDQQGNHTSQREVDDIISENRVDLWLNVLDAGKLEQQLYLTVQLLEANQNVILVLNRIDLLPNLKKEIDIKALGDFLDVPVIKVSAKLGLGVNSLQSMISESLKKESHTQRSYPVRYPTEIEILLKKVSTPGQTRFDAWKKIIAGDYQDNPPAWHFDKNVAKVMSVYQTMTDAMALTRHEAIGRWANQVVKEYSKSRKDTDKAVDKWALHNLYGMPIFFMMMFLVFWLSMGFGQLLQGILEPVLTLLFVNIPKVFVQKYALPFYVDVFLSQGIGLSFVTALSFFPILFVMFFALNLLEESGYMTRAAIVMDRLMRYLDLPGESMVALVLGLGCNVPGILATRHIPSKGDKIITALMMPFMSCGARLSIFAVFSSVFFPEKAAQVLFFLYVLGVGVAFGTGLLIKYTGLVGEKKAQTYLLELPQYQWPSMTMALKQAVRRSQRFVWRALGVIMPVCVVLAILNHISIDGQILQHPGDQSILASIGKMLSILFYPIGLKAQHWPMVVSLIMGLLAKEVVISTLSIFYVQMEVSSIAVAQNISELWSECWVEVWGNLGHGYAYFLPFFDVDVPTWMPYLNANHISASAVMGYLIFTLLYFPCISTLYAQAKQVGWRWAGVSVLWSTVVAYVCASGYLLCCHVSSGVWGMSAILAVVVLGYYAKEWLIARIKNMKKKKALTT